jgi:hypothetical protein
MVVEMPGKASKMWTKQKDLVVERKNNGKHIWTGDVFITTIPAL